VVAVSFINIYRIWILSTFKIICIRDVTFDEAFRYRLGNILPLPPKIVELVEIILFAE